MKNAKNFKPLLFFPHPFFGEGIRKKFFTIYFLNSQTQITQWLLLLLLQCPPACHALLSVPFSKATRRKTRFRCVPSAYVAFLIFDF